MVSVSERDRQRRDLDEVPSEALVRFRAGELSLSAYLDACTERAVEHVQGLVTQAQLDFLKQLVRQQLTTDPTLTEFVRRTTGVVPEPEWQR